MRSHEIKAYGVRVLKSRHPEIRRLRRLHTPFVHGNKHWASSWLLMDYFRHLGLPKGARVMEIGCGWGLASIYCAKQHNAIVTGVDIDPAVFPYLRLHAAINKVHIATLHKRFSKLKRRHLKDIDVVIGADICFWDTMVNPLKRFIHRALRAGVRLIIIADPGRSPFEQISNYFVKQGQGEVFDWDVQRPRDIQGRLLKLNLQAGKRVKSFSPHKSA